MEDDKYFYGVFALAVFVGAFAWVTLSQGPSTPIAVRPMLNSQTAAAAQAHTISWNKASFPSASVSLTLIRKTNTNPASYAVIRSLSASAANNGLASWIPAAGELDGTTYIQIGCVSSKSACQAALNPAI